MQVKDKIIELQNKIKEEKKNKKITSDKFKINLNQVTKNIKKSMALSLFFLCFTPLFPLLFITLSCISFLYAPLKIGINKFKEKKALGKIKKNITKLRKDLKFNENTLSSFNENLEKLKTEKFFVNSLNKKTKTLELSPLNLSNVEFPQNINKVLYRPLHLEDLNPAIIQNPQKEIPSLANQSAMNIRKQIVNKSKIEVESKIKSKKIF